MRIAIYARYSSDNQREESITAQIDAIKDYCKRNKNTIVKIYTDEAKSATSDNRPQFLQMINDSKVGIFDAVVVHKLDRFARNRYDSAHYKKKLKDNKVRLISVLENLDDSPESIILESVLQGMAEYFSANLAREVMKGMRQTAIQGKHNGGIPPLGFDVAPDKTYIINEREAEIIKLIFNRYVDGYGYTTIANELNQVGYRTKQGKEFKKIAIHDILLNEKYIGTYVFNRRADGKTLNKIKSAEEIIRIENAMPAIINKETFDIVQNRLQSQKTGKRVVKMNYLLTGKMWCGCCDGRYTGAGHVKGRDRNSENPTKYYRYACQKKCGNQPIRKDLIENAVIEKILEKILTIENIEKMADLLSKKVIEERDKSSIRIAELNLDINKYKAQIDRDFQMYYDDIIDKKICAEKVNEKQKKIQEIEQQKIILESKSYAPDKNKILEYLLEQKSNLESSDEKLQQKAINAFINRVVINAEKVDIDLIIDDEPTDSETVRRGSPPLTVSLSMPRPR